MPNDSPTQVGLLVRPGEKQQPVIDAIAHGEGQAVSFDASNNLPDEVTGLLVAGVGAYGENESVPPALHQAVEKGISVLGIGWGMHALNVAMGGRPPIKVIGHGSPSDGDTTKHSLFMAPGGKVGYTIAGSGWVTVPSAHTHGLLPAQVADGLLSSVYAEDQVVEAIEMPGREWLIGVQWPAHLPDITPKGFDSLLLALVERSEQ